MPQSSLNLKFSIKPPPSWLWLVLLTLVGATLRFYNLTFDAPLWFHPDERTIPAAIVEISFPDHPFSKLFTYGGFPVYLNYFILILLKKIFASSDPFTLALVTGRLETALLSTALIPLTYWITSRYLSQKSSHQPRHSAAPHLGQGDEKSISHPNFTYLLNPPLIATLLTTFCIGFIQFAHFGTYEIWLTFQSLILLVLALKLASHPEPRHSDPSPSMVRGRNLYQRKPKPGRFWFWLILTGIFWGLSVGTKINQLVFAPGILLALYLRHLQSPAKPVHHRLITILKFQTINLLKTFFQFIIIINLTLAVWVLTNPHLIANQPKFFSMLNYEGGLARGTIIAFYTRQFIGTLPLLFQATRVFPFILSWPVLLLGSLGLTLMLITGVKHLFILLLHHFKKHTPLILNSYYLILLFIPLWALAQLATIGTLYVKWTRYVIPILPYFILASSWLLSQLSTLPTPRSLARRGIAATWFLHQLHPHRHSEPRPGGAKNLYKSSTLYHVTTTVIITTQILWTLAFFSIYTHQDPRYAAADWAEKHLAPHAYTLSEVYDMGITAFSPALNNIHLFNFYELDDSGWHRERTHELQQYLDNTQVIIVNSRRVWKNVLDHPDQFPEAAKFYTRLFDGSLGYQKVADFTNYPRLGPLVFNTELTAEETFSVFDHPHVMIFQKAK